MPDTGNPIVIDKWLSDMLGKTAYQLKINDALANDVGARRQLETQNAEILGKPSFLYSKIAPGACASVSLLEDLNYSRVEKSLGFIKHLSGSKQGSSTTGPDNGIRLALPGDSPDVGRIARTAFSKSRFHQDPLIPDQVANRIKEAWALNFFSGGRGDAMVVAVDQSRVIGFLQILRPSDSRAVIDLVATDPAHHGQGVATRMLQFMETHYDKVQTIEVATQETNALSVKLYSKLGYTLKTSGLVYHLHGQSE